MKSVLISIRPEWVDEIFSGRKTCEVRKTKPKLEAPFKCFIYRTKGGGVVGEFTCHRVVTMSFSYKNIERANRGFATYEKTRLTDRQLIDYLGNGKFGYGWCISGLKIYENPKRLFDFGMSRPPQSWCYVEVNDEG